MLRFIIILMSVFFVGCATPPVQPEQYKLSEDEILVPINLRLDTPAYVYDYEAKVINYIPYAIRDSKLFARVDTSMMRSPYTIIIKYSWDNKADAKDFAGAMLSASTLLVVPSSHDEDHTLDVEIFLGKNIIMHKQYTEKVKVTLSMYHDPITQRKAGINALLKKMYDDILDNKILPPLSSFKDSSKKQAI